MNDDEAESRAARLAARRAGDVLLEFGRIDHGTAIPHLEDDAPLRDLHGDGDAGIGVDADRGGVLEDVEHGKPEFELVARDDSPDGRDLDGTRDPARLPQIGDRRLDKQVEPYGREP